MTNEQMLKRYLVPALLLLLLVVPIGCSTYNVSITQASASDEEDARQMYLQMALPTVLVMASGGTGSGVIFGDGTLCLTAAHVVSHQEMIPNMDPDQPPKPGPNVVESATVFKNEGLLPWVSGVEVLKINYDLDLAILKLAKKYPWAKADFAPEDPFLYQKVWISGHPNGITDAFISEGRLQDLWDAGFVLYSAPTFFGNSGGPVWTLVGKRYMVSSVVQRVYTYGFGHAITHMGLGCLPSHIREFVK